MQRKEKVNEAIRWEDLIRDIGIHMMSYTIIINLLRNYYADFLKVENVGSVTMHDIMSK